MTMKTRKFRKCSGWPSNFGGHLIPGDHLIQAGYRRGSGHSTDALTVSDMSMSQLPLHKRLSSE